MVASLTDHILSSSSPFPEDRLDSCAFAGCDKPVHCKGYCKAHYTQLSRGQELRPTLDSLPRTCKIDGCGEPIRVVREQLCMLHYDRKRRGYSEPEPRRCEVCETVFTPVRRRNTKYCSDECAITASRWMRTYGLTGLQVNAMLHMQNWQCAICGDAISRGTFHIDHDHKTGVVRELLCGFCNRGIGHFRDNPVALQAAAAYLLKHAA